VSRPEVVDRLRALRSTASLGRVEVRGEFGAQTGSLQGFDGAVTGND
jgi:hypothetical protein